ncbi:hypothetical protein BsWGS_06213 [Bradybaena similaris]
MTTLHAQGTDDPCVTGGNFNISFPEETTNLLRKVSNAPEAGYTIVVNKDPNILDDRYPFDEYFVVEYYSAQAWVIRNIKPIDRDGLTSGIADDDNVLQYMFTCTTTGGSTIYSVLKVQILDVNDNSPVFVNLPYITSIRELMSIGQIFYSNILAEDKDEAGNKQIGYTLSDIPGAQFQGAGLFGIAVEGQGSVEVTGTLDFERMYQATGGRADLCFYNMRVTAMDKGIPARSTTTSFLIYIEDDDDLGPEFVYEGCISSTEPYGPSCIRARYLTDLQPSSSQTLVFKPYPAGTSNPNGTVDIIAQDRDTLNAPIIFKIAQTVPAGFQQYFSVATAQIGQTKQYRAVVTYNPVNNVALNRNNIQSLDIILQAIQNTSNRREETATISVNLVQSNTGPPVITPNQATGYTYENSVAGTSVSQDTTTTTPLRLTISDPDLSPSDPRPQYDIRVTGGPFTVTQAGYVQLQMSNVLDYEQTKHYILIVTIADPAFPSQISTSGITVNVLDMNDLSPVFAANYDVTIEEGAFSPQAPRSLVTILANDGDFGPVTYFIISVSPAGSASKFALVSTSGALSLQGTVQANEIYFVNIRANDSGTPQRSTETVVVVMVPPHDTQIQPVCSAKHHIIYVSEDVPINTPLFDLQVTEPDNVHSQRAYAVTSEVPVTGGSFFINVTRLTNNKKLDRETIPGFSVIVSVSDSQGYSGIIVFTIIILDANDNSPYFTTPEYTFSIPEGPREDRYVGAVAAHDGDAPGTSYSAVTYSIFYQSDTSAFSIEPATGRILSDTNFDYEKQKLYQIIVRGTDGHDSPRYSEVRVNVNILDIQDEIPLFETTTAEVTVRENVSLNTVILRLPVSDADAVKNITLKLINTNGNPLTTPFGVFLNTDSKATITVNTALNYENQKVYTFIVTTEQGQGSNNPYASVTVTVNVTLRNCT